jgi:hypothetical protein
LGSVLLIIAPRSVEGARLPIEGAGWEHLGIGDFEVVPDPKRLLIDLLHPIHLRRTGFITLIVGIWLTVFNQGDVFWASELDGWLWIKVALNYLTPFVVANLGLLSKESEKSTRRNRATEH